MRRAAPFFPRNLRGELPGAALLLLFSRFLERKLGKELPAKLRFASASLEPGSRQVAGGFSVDWGEKLRRGGVSPPVSSCKNPKTERRGGYDPPATTAQPLRLVATGALSPSSATGFSLIAQPAAAARKRGQSAEPPAPGSRNDFREAFFVTGVRGRATGVLALLGASPRGSLVLSIIGKNTEGGIPPPRRRVPLPAAAKEPKRRFFRPLWRFVPSGGQNLSGFSPLSGPLGPGAAEIWPCRVHRVRLAFAMLFGWAGNGGRMRPIPPIRGKWPKAKRGRGHPPLLKSTIFGVGAGVLTGPPITDRLLRLVATGVFSCPFLSSKSEEAKRSFA